MSRYIHELSTDEAHFEVNVHGELEIRVELERQVATLRPSELNRLVRFLREIPEAE